MGDLNQRWARSSDVACWAPGEGRDRDGSKGEGSAGGRGTALWAPWDSVPVAFPGSVTLPPASCYFCQNPLVPCRALSSRLSPPSKMEFLKSKILQLFLIFYPQHLAGFPHPSQSLINASWNERMGAFPEGGHSHISSCATAHFISHVTSPSLSFVESPSWRASPSSQSHCPQTTFSNGLLEALPWVILGDLDQAEEIPIAFAWAAELGFSFSPLWYTVVRPYRT